MELDTTKLRQTGFRKTVTHDNCIVLDIGSGSYPRYIEVRPPGDDGSRMTAIWDGSLELAVNDKVKCIEYGGNPVWAISAMGGDDSAVGKVRVSKVWESDFENIVISINATGLVTFQPAVDSTTFFQVLDADGGSPVLNINTVDEFIGIGGTAQSKLHVIAGDLSLDNNQGIFFKDSIGTLRTFFTIDGSDILFIGPAGSPVGTTSAIKFRPGADIAMTIDEGGDVGVGIETMLAAFHVRGDATDRGYIAIETADGTITTGEVIGGIKFISGDASTPAPTDKIVAKIEAIAEGNHFGSNFDTGIGFFTVDGTTLTEHMRLDEAGLLGINGVTAPSAELDIGAGAMEFEEMTAPGAGAVNTARLFTQDNGAGKTQLAVRFNTGAIQILATEP